MAKPMASYPTSGHFDIEPRSVLSPTLRLSHDQPSLCLLPPDLFQGLRLDKYELIPQLLHKTPNCWMVITDEIQLEQNSVIHGKKMRAFTKVAFVATIYSTPMGLTSSISKLKPPSTLVTRNSASKYLALFVLFLSALS